MKNEDYIVHVKLEYSREEIEAYNAYKRSPQYHSDIMYRLNNGDYYSVIEEIPELADDYEVPTDY